MLYDKLDHIIIDQALLVLKCIHKSFFTDPVDHTRDPGRCFMDLIQRFGCKDLLGTSGVIHMVANIDVIAVVVIADLTDDEAREQGLGAQMLEEKYGAKTFSIIKDKDVKKFLESNR